MKKILLVLLTTIVLLFLGCGRKETALLRYEPSTRGDLFISEWEGTGYEPAFRDMSDLYGRMSNEVQTTPTRSRENITSPAAGGSGSNLPEDYERKLVKSADISIRVENLEASDQAISGLLEQYNAYSASTFADENSRRYSLRVPAHFYETFIADMGGMGRILNRHERTEDVTIRYYDLESRLSTKRELLRTYQSYLRRATNIEEILAVEAKISELQREIDQTGTQLRNLANRVDYATIELIIYGPVTASSQSQHDTLGERIKRLFSGFGGFLSTVAVGFLGFVIYGIPILAIGVLLFWLLFGKVGLARKLWAVIKR